MSMRNYPERITAKRVVAENRMAILEKLHRDSAISDMGPFQKHLPELPGGTAGMYNDKWDQKLEVAHIV
jgi:hypothetical protein